MISRQAWFKKRIEECLENIAELNKFQNWNEFREQAHELACELLYATSEWDKYYRCAGDER